MGKQEERGWRVSASPCVSGSEQERAGQQAHPTPGPLTGEGPAIPLSALGLQTRGSKCTKELTGECGKVQKWDLFSCTEAAGRSPTPPPCLPPPLRSGYCFLCSFCSPPCLTPAVAPSQSLSLSLSLPVSLSVSSWGVTLFLPYLPLHLLLGSFGLSVWGSLLLVTGPTLSFICSLRPCAGLPAPLPSWRWSPTQPERAFPALATPEKVAFPPSRATVVGQCPRPVVSWAISSSLTSSWYGALIFLEAASVFAGQNQGPAELPCS